MKSYQISSWFRNLGKNKGQVAIMVAVSSLVLAGFSALSIDMGNYMFIRQRMQNALDAAALAGAQGLGVSRDEAIRLAEKFADKNGLEPADIEPIKFGCMVDRVQGSPDPGLPERSDIIRICNQHEKDAQNFKCNAKNCHFDCDFSQGGSRAGCNVINVISEKKVQPLLASILGDIGPLTAKLESAACRGSCGTPPDLDVILILDRTVSLTDEQFNNVITGAIDILDNEALVPELHRFAVAVVPAEPSRRGNYLLTDELLPSGDSRLTDPIKVLKKEGSSTDLATPIRQATDLLTGVTGNPDAFNPDAFKQIVLLTDGVPKVRNSTEPLCQNAFNAAVEARQASPAVGVFTIGYFQSFEKSTDANNRCNPDNESLPWQNRAANELLYRMAVGSIDQDLGNDFGPDACKLESENGDDDGFFCVFADNPESKVDLDEVFSRIIKELFDRVGSGSNLVDLATLR